MGKEQQQQKDQYPNWIVQFSNGTSIIVNGADIAGYKTAYANYIPLPDGSLIVRISQIDTERETR